MKLNDHAWLERFRKASYENNYSTLSPFVANLIAKYIDEYIAESEATEIKLRGMLSRLVGYLATAKQENTDEWMDRLAEMINQANETLGDPDRVKYLGCNLGGWIEVCCRECGGSGAVDSGGFDPYGLPINVPCSECSP